MNYDSDYIKYCLVVCSADCGIMREGGIKYKICKSHGHTFTRMSNHINKVLGPWLPAVQPNIDAAGGTECEWCHRYLPRGEGMTCYNCAAKLRRLPAWGPIS